MSRQSKTHATRPDLNVARCLALAFDWYQGMVSSDTGRLVYLYEPGPDTVMEGGSAIRNIASIWNLEMLSRFLGRDELDPLIKRSIEHYASFLVSHDEPDVHALRFDAARLGEPAGIAHSAFMLLALLEAPPAIGIAAPQETARALANGILGQQRSDGSYRIYFSHHRDDGLEFYPGEAMLALMQAFRHYQEPCCLASVESGFSYYRDRFPVEAIEGTLRVFQANWQSQYAALLHADTRSETLRNEVRDYIFSLHDRIIAGGFYENLEHYPGSQATVEVGCALEGLNDAYTIAARVRDQDRITTYAGCIRSALKWLAHAQRTGSCTARERGGFGHSLTHRTQRIDVTGHVVSGFIKSAQNKV